MALILRYYNYNLESILETNASNRIIIKVLLQLYLDGN
jgi:hypothetical protein